MKKIVMILVAVGLSWGFFQPAWSQNNQEYKAWISIESQNDHLVIKAYCFNNTSKDSIIRYQLEAKKIGKKGKTFSFQSGAAFIPAQEDKLLSLLTLRFFPQDRYLLKLKVFKDKKPVAEDFVVYPPGVMT